jgi:uncharacterized protein
MRCLHSYVVSIVWVILAVVTGTVKGDIQDVVGSWMGVLHVADLELRIAFTIQVDQAGSLTAEWHSVDEAVYDIPVVDIQYDGQRLTLDLDVATAIFEGRLVSGRVSFQLDGLWRQGAQAFPLKLKPVEEIPRPIRPQEPRPPFPYMAYEVAFDNVQAGVQLAGTLTMPPGPGPFPAVITISGSGSQDRNSTFFEHKPFWVLADYLTRVGIAVLRYDDRGVGGSTNAETEATTADLAGDVGAAVSFLVNHPGIDPNRIGLIGHSEGGIIAPMVATEIENIALIALLGGAALPGAQILLDQNEDILRAQGGAEPNIEIRLTYLHRVFQILENYPDDVMAQKEIKEAFIQIHGPGTSSEELDNEAAAWISPWMRFFVLYDPGPTLGQVGCPILALYGGLDIQVEAKQNLSAMEAILEQAGHPDYLIQELPDLNHLFQTAQTGVLEEYAQIEETFSPVALNLIGTWISERFFDGIDQ